MKEEKTYQLWCNYCGVDLIITQETQPTPHQLVCQQCLSILDSYEVKEKGTLNECQEI